jgi:hypothetical protein
MLVMLLDLYNIHQITEPGDDWLFLAYFLASFLQKANNTELQMAWDCYLTANESCQNTEAKIQTKREIKV